jgi:hypothetical protein
MNPTRKLKKQAKIIINPSIDTRLGGRIFELTYLNGIKIELTHFFCFLKSETMQ